MSDTKEKIYNSLHERMVQTYGEDYAVKDNVIKDSEPLPGITPGSPLSGVKKLIRPKEKNKVFVNGEGHRYLKLNVSFDLPIYLDTGEKNLSINDIQSKVNEIDPMELVDLLFDGIDYRNIIKC